ncbi:hypothetical protein [Mesorhizobium sp. M7A.F.Ca.US.011.01.1.1]|uniref:hypothetical protein n=1 Tax=Mesorhizobium sp. M7A.F.Ca.US.011.01.1.1 TaxID=2496741 RepID=UPI0032B01D69
MPDVDAGAGKWAAVRVDNLQPNAKGYALLAFGDVRTFEFRVEIERPLGHFRRNGADTGSVFEQGQSGIG